MTATVLGYTRTAGLSAWFFCTSLALAQASGTTTDAVPTPQQLQQSMQRLSADLAAAQERLQQSQLEIQRLQQEMLLMQAQLANATGSPLPAPAPPPSATAQETDEKVDILQAEVKQHAQAKVESVSKYPVRVTGLILFNSFVDKGGVDNIDIPASANPPTAGVSNLSAGASVRQTILGVQATGPRLLGAQTSGEVSVDFDGGIPYSSYGTTAGIVRMRSAALRLQWDNDSAEVGFVGPLISPLSPASYASVAEPALAGAGNLWTWAPQLSFEHRFPVTGATRIALQVGLWDPPAAGYNLNALFRTPSAGERTGQPAYETRTSYSRGTVDHGLQLGLGGYYSRQSYTGRSGDSWAATGDWRIPVGSFFELSGEAYRGRSIGGLGGGVYKDIVTGTDPVSGLSTFRLLNAGGGWAQAKFHLTRTFEANGAFGLDDGFTRDFHSLILSASASGNQLRARNRMASMNLIFTPKSYLILSPEFRRIWTWPISGLPATANIFTLSFALRF
jgi:hypothetical protein